MNTAASCAVTCSLRQPLAAALTRGWAHSHWLPQVLSWSWYAEGLSACCMECRGGSTCHLQW